VDTFYALLADGSQLGMHITYAVQPVAKGIADALLIGENFLAGDDVCLALGDNIFHAPSLPAALKRARENNHGATVFGYYVDDPRPFGVVEFGPDGKAISIEEKPKYPKSNYIIPGLYFYDHQVIEIAKGLTPSARGELEITDVNLEYLRRNQLNVIPLDQDFVWLDAGTADSLLVAAQAIRDVQDQGRYVACIEEIARNEGWITTEQVHEIGKSMKKTNYGEYLLSL
jgi:glucose-1-phosphate thymidylyltransferase